MRNISKNNKLDKKKEIIKAVDSIFEFDKSLTLATNTGKEDSMEYAEIPMYENMSLSQIICPFSTIELEDHICSKESVPLE